MTKKIALLASGKGSNAKNISTFFKDSENIATVEDAISFIETAK